MTISETQYLSAVEGYVTPYFKEHILEKYVYHDLSHTKDVVWGVCRIGEAYHLGKEDMMVLQIAAWFHDLGYDKGPENHELRGAKLADAFLHENQFLLDRCKDIKNCILATKFPQKPEGLLQQIICDSDLSHLGEKSYWLKSSLVRHEMVITQNLVMTELEWVEFELNFMISHRYHTNVARELFERRKFKHILQLQKQKTRLLPQDTLAVEDVFADEKAKEKKHKRERWHAETQKAQESRHEGIGRGVETMYRTTYDTHNNLSALADHKANQMLSVNTIMIAIALATMVPRPNESGQFFIPTIFLLCVCLASIVLATLATRPKVTHGEVTLDDIRQKRSNLLFFGNFYNMKLEDFQWGIMEMIKDPDFQYSSMTRDLYYLGKVLAQKYRYMTYCYNIFMFGMIISVVMFTVAFVYGPTWGLRIR